MSAFEDAERDAAEWIVGNIDEEGFLRADVEEIARQSGLAAELVERALDRVQAFDPPGVGARDLRECLLLQLGPRGLTLPLVRALIADHWEALQKRDFRGIARVRGIPIEEVAAAQRLIATLEPRPGHLFGGEDPVYITPDIYIHKIGDEFHVVLNEDGLPKLRINALYRDVLIRARSSRRRPAITCRTRSVRRSG